MSHALSQNRDQRDTERRRDSHNEPPHNFEFYNGFIANVKTRHMSSLQLAREMVKAGVPYYNDPRSLYAQEFPLAVCERVGIATSSSLTFGSSIQVGEIDV